MEFFRCAVEPKPFDGVYLLGISLISFAVLTGCATHEKPFDSGTTHATPKFTRTYYPTLSCSDTTRLGQPRPRRNALIGYAVGPKAKLSNPKLRSGILRPFVSDGCSASPDGLNFADESADWVDCCIHHDTAYWLGGTRAEKNQADRNLETCIREKSFPRVAKLYAAVVNKFGEADSSRVYRWGYGWNFRRPYSEITSDEERQIRDLYAVGKSEVFQKIFDATTEIAQYCESNDPVLGQLTAEEKIAYEILNSKLLKEDAIEWSRWRPSRTKVLEVKLRNCETPVKFDFRVAPDAQPSVTTDCF